MDGEERWGNGERRWVTVAKNGNGTVTVTGTKSKEILFEFGPVSLKLRYCYICLAFTKKVTSV